MIEQKMTNDFIKVFTNIWKNLLPLSFFLEKKDLANAKAAMRFCFNICLSLTPNQLVVGININQLGN